MRYGKMKFLFEKSQAARSGGWFEGCADELSRKAIMMKN
jgi:hypothetical protein